MLAGELISEMAKIDIIKSKELAIAKLISQKSDAIAVSETLDTQEGIDKYIKDRLALIDEWIIKLSINPLDLPMKEYLESERKSISENLQERIRFTKEQLSSAVTIFNKEIDSINAIQTIGSIEEIIP